MNARLRSLSGAKNVTVTKFNRKLLPCVLFFRERSVIFTRCARQVKVQIDSLVVAFLVINTGGCYRSRGLSCTNKSGFAEFFFALLPCLKAAAFLLRAGPSILHMSGRALVDVSRLSIVLVFGCYDIFKRDPP